MMKIYVDHMERENLGKVVLDKENILSVSRTMSNRFYNEHYSVEQRKKIRDGYDVIHKLIDLYNTQDNLAKDPHKGETLEEIEKEIKEEKERIRDKILPHLKDLYGAQETDLSNYLSQGDVFILGKKKTMWELKHTSVDLKTAIEDTNKRADIVDSFERCKTNKISYRLAVALPEENEKEAEWRENNDIYQKDYSEFFGMTNPNPRKIRMPNEVYTIDDTFFLDLEDSIDKLKEKQKITMDYLISKSA